MNNRLKNYSEGINSYIQSKNLSWNIEGTATSFFRNLSKSNEFSTDNIQFLSYKKPVVVPQKKIVIKKRTIDDVDLSYLEKMLRKYKGIRSKMPPSPDKISRNAEVEAGDKLHNDYLNTIGLVQKVAKNSLHLDDSLNQKRRVLCECLKSCDLPEIEDYNSKDTLYIILI